LSANKVRKLEYHMKAVMDAGAATVLTCGATQSNHSGATAHAAARLGLRTILYLPTPDGQPPTEVWGNHLLQRLAGAECRFIPPEQYDERDSIMETAAHEIGDAWVIPEGASDTLSARGFVNAAHELADQVKDIGGPFTLWHASMSAGTTAGLILGAGDAGLDMDIGGGYGVISDAEMAVQAEATRLTGLLFDPTYTDKAIYGLSQEINQGRFGPKDTIVFWHTGGGFATFAYDWSQFVQKTASRTQRFTKEGPRAHSLFEVSAGPRTPLRPGSGSDQRHVLSLEFFPN
jgi:1-aminocyclopropane-1-carboxylate deaminase/D-cysteine desulfhydrase-like pyridoxal-dependent ACC family enzyme